VKQGLILFAHGARDPRWSRPFEAVAERIRSEQPALEVRLAFLEFLSPAMLDAGADLVRAGCVQIEVMPMFLGTGGHVQRDLPRLLEQLRAAHPEAHFGLHTPVGELPSVRDAMAAAALALLRREPA
jgi:sirohydrochlorin cobaltochelatase